MASGVLPTASPSPQSKGSNASPSLLQHTSPQDAATNARRSSPHTHSAPVLSTNASRTSILAQHASNASQHASASERAEITRGYTAHVPYNPNRPPPHTYTRQHEFPPFPPLAQHPVLPFLTTAFTNLQESHTAPLPTKARPTLAPRVSSTGRHTHSILSTIPTMDVSKNDPTAIFIRPPLVVPLLHNNDPSVDPSCMSGTTMDGEPVPGTPLTYGILHTHRNWFLDAEDFRKDNPNRVDYPHDLEPPRGWAPLSECTGAGAANRCKQAKEKKEKNNAVRTKGSYAHADNALTDTTIEYGPSDDCHEKTVLRCTFCRREYHGPNAKSMWRRHVFDKHKVAMKNRREGSAGMAPRLSQTQKKAKPKAAEPSIASLGPPLTGALTLDLTNEQNLVRLIERVVSGNLDISLPASLLNLSGNGNAVNLEAIALALQKSGISLATEDGESSPQSTLSASCTGSNPEPGAVVKKVTSKSRKRDEQRRERERRDEEIMRAAAGPSLGVDDKVPSQNGPSSIALDDAQDCLWTNKIDSPMFSASLSPVRVSNAEATSHGQKRKVEEAEHDGMSRTSSNLDRAPLKDNTLLDRNNHNQSLRVIRNTPHKDKGKQTAIPTTPGASKLSQESFLSSSPSPRHPYTPIKPPTALRSRALATTGEESYLTRIVSSPATPPGRGGGRVSSSSPFRPRASPMKRNDWNYPSTSDDTYGNLAASSPRYPFEFNIQGIQNSPVAAFEPIPLELGNLGPAHWTPPSLASSAPPSKLDCSPPISRASSIGDPTVADDRNKARDNDGDMELGYPDWTPPSVERIRNHLRTVVDDFDMEAYLDLEDAGPASEPNMPSSPCKNAASRGLQFSKEYGLLSPAEVERITASAHPRFMEETRIPKRRRVEVS